jgi:hypothetical protein
MYGSGDGAAAGAAPGQDPGPAGKADEVVDAEIVDEGDKK